MSHCPNQCFRIGESGFEHRLAWSLFTGSFHFEVLHFGQQIESHLVENRSSLDVIGIRALCAVLIEGHIKAPMQRVLDPPMAANATHHSLRDVLSVKGERGDEIARLFTGFPCRSHRALRCRFNEAAVFKPRPLLDELAIEHADAGGQNTDGAFFVTTVSFIDASASWPYQTLCSY